MTSDDLFNWRSSMGLSQRKAAKSLGVSLRTYQVMERGEDFYTKKRVLIDTRTELACLALSSGLNLIPKP